MTKINTSFSSKNSYSQAFFELALENNSTDLVEEQVSAILIMINKSLDFKLLIKDPTNKIDDQVLVIKEMSKKFNFFYIEEILKDFISICSNARGEIEAELSAAKSLNQIEINKIKEELTNNFGSNIKLNYKHDQSLIGGLIIKVGSIMIDTSIKNKLQQLEKKMIEA